MSNDRRHRRISESECVLTLRGAAVEQWIEAAGTMLLRAQPKGERVTITGEVVAMWCYLEGGDRGPAKKDCAPACAKAGNPIGILDARGNLSVDSVK